MVNRPNRPQRKKRSGGFSNYQAPSAASIKKIAEQKGGRFDTIFLNKFDSWRAKEGDNQIRILPPTWDNYDHYAYEVWVHKNVGSDNSTYLCLNKNKSPKTGQPMAKPCPICDAVKRMKADGDAEGAKEIQVTQQYVCWIVDRESKKEFPPLLWAMSWTQNRDLASLSYNSRTGKTLVIAHGEEGYDVQVKRMGTGIGTKYVLAIDREESPISEDEDTLADLEDFCNENPVPATLKFYAADYLDNIISGTAEEEDEDLDDDKPKKRRSRDEDEEAEEEDEDEKPYRSSRRPRRDADEEEENNEEEDEDEKPTKRRRARNDDEETEEDEEKPKTRSHRQAEEDEEDNEDEDEDEKPRRGGIARRKLRKTEDDEDEDEKPRNKTTRRRR